MSSNPMVAASAPVLEALPSVGYAHEFDDNENTRYAIYFAPPPASAWWTFGCAWLGRDPVVDADVARPRVARWDAAYFARITAKPRRYGFHATLKAPFRLAPGYTAQNVYLQAANLASSLNPARLPPLQLAEIDGFVALSFTHGDTGQHAAHAVAAQCVSGFDNLRAPATAAELARRHTAPLTARQTRLLAEWGYPHAFDEFRFHLTLTGRLPAAERQQIIDALSPLVDALNAEPLLLDALSIYRQPAWDAPFVVMRRYRFNGSVDIYRCASSG